jgi:hypothetical protein
MTNEVQGADAPEIKEDETKAVETPAENVNDEQEVVEGDDPEQKKEELQEPQETVEQRLERLEKETTGKQKAIDRKTAALGDANRKIQELMQEMQTMRQAQPQDQDEPEPNIDDFETHADYVDAMANHRAKKLVQAERDKMQQEVEKAKIVELQQQRERVRVEQEKEYLVENPLYEDSKKEFFGFVQAANVNPAVENAIVEQAFDGNVPQLIDYFGANNGENLDKLAEIVKLSPVKAAVEIYKLQQSLATPVNQKKEKPAFKPAAKMPKGKGAPKKTLDDLSGDELLKALNLK